MQSPLVGEGRFLERQPVSHELHRFWRYVKPLFSIFFNPQLIQKCNFFSFFFLEISLASVKFRLPPH